jgi:formylglycine-generating enzyme required for sulfatase activity
MLPGRYTVHAEREGHRPLAAPIEVTGERGQTVALVLEPLPGRLLLDTTPPHGVRVSVDGTGRGTTPVGALELDRGDHEIELRAEGYAPFQGRVTMAGLGAIQTFRAALVPDRAPVSFSSEPPGATVRVDGGDVGRTPLTTDLTSGSRRVEVSLPGHGTASRRIDVVPDRPLTVPVFRLSLLPGRVTLGSDPPGAAVSVGGAFRGQTPLELELAPGEEHALRLTRAGHQPAEARVSLDPGESRALALTLEPLLGDVEVVAQPADAEVLVDGQPRGHAGQTLRLTAAPHEVEVRKEGYEPHRVTLTPRPGFTQAVRVRLKATADAAPAERPRVLRTAGGHDLRLLSPGRFRMGASRREPGRRANETLRDVELARPAYVATSEVTNAHFRRFRPGHSSGRFGAHSLEDDARPVVNVTWEDAAAFCNWLSAQEGLTPAYVVRDGKTVGARPLTNGYRLPTEAEWSRAARYPAEEPLKYPWGDALPVPPRAGNYADESAKSVVGLVLRGYDDGHPVSAPVGSFGPNPLGFVDLGGNVAEWVHDAYTIPPADGPVERDPAGPEAGDLHVILGASYLQGAVTALRLSYRDYGTKPRPDVGFRIARYAE